MFVTSSQMMYNVHVNNMFNEYLFNMSKQESQTRTSFSMPYLGTIEVFEEHLLQKICPQARQWCWKQNIVIQTKISL